jgi:glucosamine--fructose-6-phosphate aminotransferase (isomerizing)
MNQKYFSDIISQPTQWNACLTYFLGDGLFELENVVDILRNSNKIYLVGIGASYNAGLALKHLLRPYLNFIELYEAGEFLYSHVDVSDQDCIVFLSRSGKSIELVKIIDIYQYKDIKTICICNDVGSSLSQKCNHTLYMNSIFDYNISVNTYTTMLCIGMVLKQCFIDLNSLSKEIENWQIEIERVHQYINDINAFLERSDFIDYEKNLYLLGRNDNFIHACATALLCEEGAKKPNVPKYTSSFRHGTQEVISNKLAILIWLNESSPTFSHDLYLVEDLRKNKVSVLAFSSNTLDDGNQNIELPSFSHISLLTDHIIGQLFVFHLATKNHIDTDNFLFCDYIVQHEGGL